MKSGSVNLTTQILLMSGAVLETASIPEHGLSGDTDGTDINGWPSRGLGSVCTHVTRRAPLPGFCTRQAHSSTTSSAHRRGESVAEAAVLAGAGCTCANPEGCACRSIAEVGCSVPQGRPSGLQAARLHDTMTDLRLPRIMVGRQPLVDASRRGCDTAAIHSLFAWRRRRRLAPRCPSRYSQVIGGVARGSLVQDNVPQVGLGRGRQSCVKPSQYVPPRRRERSAAAGFQKGPQPARREPPAPAAPGDPAGHTQGV